MADCIPENTFVVTLSIVTHGSTISTSLTSSQQDMMSDTRLFSLSGGFDDVVCLDSMLTSYSEYLYTIFRKNLDQGSYKPMREYTELVKPKYGSFRELFEVLENPDFCTVFQTITVDKIFGIETKPTDNSGIFVVSVHKKKGDELLLEYPKKGNPNDVMNLLVLSDFRRFADIFHAKIPADIFSNMDEKFVKIDKSGRWIERIRMSYLVYIIKKLVPVDSDLEEGRTSPGKINIFDYSCSGLSAPSTVNQEQRNELRYMHAEDEEQGIPKWGGF